MATLVIPVYNGASTLPILFKSLDLQHDKSIIREVLIIDDASTDNSLVILDSLMKKVKGYKFKLIKRSKNRGLAAGYNDALEQAKTEFVILMHQDISLKDKNSFSKVLLAFKNNGILASYPTFIYEKAVWIDNDFWQKVLFCRIIDKKVSKLNGKFDCIRVSSKLRFDDKHYRTAGEDFDFEVRLNRVGQIQKAHLEVSHIQCTDNLLTLKKLIKKEAQLAECYGVNVRRYPLDTPIVDLLRLFYRPLIVVLLFVPNPVVLKLSLLLIGSFSFLYTYKVFLFSYTNIRILILPFVNIANLFIYAFVFAKGFVVGIQKI